MHLVLRFSIVAFYLWSSHHFQTHFVMGMGVGLITAAASTISISLLRQSALGSNIDTKEPTENTQILSELNFACGRRQ